MVLVLPEFKIQCVVALLKRALTLEEIIIFPSAGSRSAIETV